MIVMTRMRAVKTIAINPTAGEHMPVIRTPSFVTSENHMELRVKITKTQRLLGLTGDLTHSGRG